MKTELIGRKTYERELDMCRELSKKNGGKCNWGVCKSCGVIPLLYKLHKGVLLEDEKDINKKKMELL
jgi:hypothetical protein